MREVKVEVFIPLTKGKVAVIDFEDFDKVRGFKWNAVQKRRCWYARGPDSKYLHRILMGVTSKKIQVDHIDGDGLNNTRKNLRICNNQQNNCAKKRIKLNATSGFRGVSWDKQTGLWRAKIMHNRKTISLGRFLTEIDAAGAYDKKAKELFGEFASPNFK